MVASRKPSYFVLQAYSDKMLLLFGPPDPSFDDDWFGGRRFETAPVEPIVVTIRPKNEDGELLPFFGTATLMSTPFYEALREAGVDNLDVYEAVIQSEDGSIVYKGYKAFNLIGVVRAADLERTSFSDPEGPRLIDASIETLAIDPDKAGGALMFRLAEYVGAVIVHEKVKDVLEAKGFPYVSFLEPSEFIS
jgi:hypothetical protein